jgi:hypothetical protein
MRRALARNAPGRNCQRRASAPNRGSGTGRGRVGAATSSELRRSRVDEILDDSARGGATRARRGRSHVPETARTKRHLPAVASIAATTTAAATTATAAAIATAAATTVAAAATESAAATTTLRTLFRLVHAERTTVEVRAVHRFNGLLGLGRRTHRDEPEPTRLTRRAVGHDMDVRDLADAREGLTNGLSGGRKRQVADIQTRSHVSLFSRLRPRVRLRSARPSTRLPIDRRKSAPGRGGEIRRVDTSRCRRSPIRGPEVERAVVAGETSVSKSKDNGRNCPRKLFADGP